MRKDIPHADQIVQIGHACLEGGFQFKRPDETIHLVVVGIESEKHLLATLERIGLKGIRFVVFHEPDDEMGFTAACTQPLSATHRREFRDFPLWEPPREVTQA
ncbi:MAG: hypothetical protein QM730_07145 [Anaerolineales bacterium]